MGGSNFLQSLVSVNTKIKIIFKKSAVNSPFEA